MALDSSTSSIWMTLKRPKLQWKIVTSMESASGSITRSAVDRIPVPQAFITVVVEVLSAGTLLPIGTIPHQGTHTIVAIEATPGPPGGTKAPMFGFII